MHTLLGPLPYTPSVFYSVATMIVEGGCPGSYNTVWVKKRHGNKNSRVDLNLPLSGETHVERKYCCCFDPFQMLRSVVSSTFKVVGNYLQDLFNFPNKTQ